MSAPAFTPGPWHVAGDRFDPRGGGRDSLISAPGWTELATVATWMEGDDAPDPTGIANACLIAGAPELYSALRSIEGLVADAVDQKIRTGRLPSIAALLTAIADTAHVALAKVGAK